MIVSISPACRTKFNFNFTTNRSRLVSRWNWFAGAHVLVGVDVVLLLAVALVPPVHYLDIRYTLTIIIIPPAMVVSKS